MYYFCFTTTMCTIKYGRDEERVSDGARGGLRAERMLQCCNAAPGRANDTFRDYCNDATGEKKIKKWVLNIHIVHMLFVRVWTEQRARVVHVLCRRLIIAGRCMHTQQQPPSVLSTSYSTARTSLGRHWRFDAATYYAAAAHSHPPHEPTTAAGNWWCSVQQLITIGVFSRPLSSFHSLASIRGNRYPRWSLTAKRSRPRPGS